MGLFTNYNKKIDKLLKNAPKYKIADEAYENQNLARSAAFGRNRAIQMQEENIDQGTANAAATVAGVSSNTSDLLSTIAAISANATGAKRGLAQDEASVQQENMANLYNVNQAMIDEKDKEWDYNTNMPFQNKLKSLRDRKQARANAFNTVLGGLFSGAGALLGNPGIFGGGGEQPKHEYSGTT